MNKIRVGVTGTGSLIGQAIIKSIKRSRLSEDISVIGFDYFEGTMGSYWTDKSFLLPDFLKKEINGELYLERVVEIILSEKIEFFFIGIDFELPVFSMHREVIEKKTGCKVIISDPDVIEIADDKYKTYNFLKENGFSYPKTSLLPEELSKEGIGYPCIVKPRIGARSRDIFIVSNRQELYEKFSAVSEPIIQELIGVSNEEYTCGVVNLDGKIKGSIVLRRILKEGNTETAYYTKDTPDSIYDYIAQITEKLNPFGACNFQLRLDEGGTPKLFEINARHSGTTYIRALFGFNEIEHIISYLLGTDVKRSSLKEGMVKRYYEEAFIGI